MESMHTSKSLKMESRISLEHVLGPLHGLMDGEYIGLSGVSRDSTFARASLDSFVGGNNGMHDEDRNPGRCGRIGDGVFSGYEKEGRLGPDTRCGATPRVMLLGDG